MAGRAVVAIAVVLSSCAVAPPNPAPRSGHAPISRAAPAPSPVASGLELRVEPTSAEILVDGEPRGTVAEIASSGGVLVLPPGIYQVSLRAAGHVTWRAEVAVRSGRERIEVKLQTKP